MSIILPSFWENETYLRKYDIAIVGGGIVGLSTAISIKERDPYIDVVVIDRNAFPLGASTRNAGFACFGSVTEILDDLTNDSEDAVFQLLKDRFDGLNILRKRVGDDEMEFENNGSYEVFDQDDINIEGYIHKVNDLNSKIQSYTGLKGTFSIIKDQNFGFSGFDNMAIYNQYEGQIHTGKMMVRLQKYARELNVEFLLGMPLNSIEQKGSSVLLRGNSFEVWSDKVIVATNGFANQLIGNLDVQPARNQVLVTEPIEGLTWKTCFHYDRGYVYFRNIGSRILIGGARNLDFDKETTTALELTETIRTQLEYFLHERLCVPKEVKISHSWAGIMGVGTVKRPILKYHSDKIILAVRMGGMGVALGSLIGLKAANMALDYITNTTE